MRFPVSILMGLVATALTGCHPKQADSSHEESDSQKVSLYQKGKGLMLPEEMKTLFGLEIVEVTEKPLSRSLTKTAQVYRAADGEEPAWASLPVNADEAKELKPGQPVSLHPVPASGSSITGKLVRLDEDALPVIGHIEALIEFSDTGRRFPAGAVLTASFLTREAKPGFAIPETALLSCANGSFVYTVNGDHLTRTAVRTRPASAGFVEIEDGLYGGDSVVVKGADNLWFVELSALKGGTPCCPVPKKNAGK